MVGSGVSDVDSFAGSDAPSYSEATSGGSDDDGGGGGGYSGGGDDDGGSSPSYRSVTRRATVTDSIFDGGGGTLGGRDDPALSDSPGGGGGGGGGGGDTTVDPRSGRLERVAIDRGLVDSVDLTRNVGDDGVVSRESGALEREAISQDIAQSTTAAVREEVAADIDQKVDRVDVGTDDIVRASDGDRFRLDDETTASVARQQAAADAPLREPDDFVADTSGEEVSVRRRARPFFEDQREALGLNPPEESGLRRRLREGSATIRGTVDDLAERQASVGVGDVGQVVEDSSIPGSDALPTVTGADQTRGAGAVADLPGAVDSAVRAGERAANVGQARVESTAAEAGLGDEGFDVDADAFETEVDAQQAALGQTASTAATTARTDPGVFVGAVGAGVASGVASGAALGSGGRAVTRAVRRRQGPTFELDDLSGDAPRARGTTENPEFSEAAMGDTDIAVAEFRGRMRDAPDELVAEGEDGLAFSGRSDEAVREFGEFTGRGEDSFDAPAGTSEIEGQFFSADLSPLRLPDGGDAGFSSRPTIGRPRLRDRSQIAAADLDIDSMPESVRTLDTETPDGRELGDASRFLNEDGEAGVGYVRSQAIRTPEQEVVVPAGSTFRRTARRFNVETDGGEVVPARVFRPEGDADAGGASSAVDDLADSLGFGRSSSRPRTRIDRRGTPDIEVGPTVFGSGTSASTTGGLTGTSAGLTGSFGLGSSGGATTPTGSGTGLGSGTTGSPTGSGSGRGSGSGTSSPPSGSSPTTGSPASGTTGSPTSGPSFGGSGGSGFGGSTSSTGTSTSTGTGGSGGSTTGTDIDPPTGQTGRVPEPDGVELEDEADVLLNEDDDLFDSGIAEAEDIAAGFGFDADADRFGF